MVRSRIGLSKFQFSAKLENSESTRSMVSNAKNRKSLVFEGTWDKTTRQLKYISYYINNPNVFEFFYFYQLSKPNKKAEDKETEINFPEIWKETFKGFVLEGKISEAEIEVVAKIFIYAMHGMLTLCFSNNGDFSDKSIYQDL